MERQAKFDPADCNDHKAHAVRIDDHGLRLKAIEELKPTSFNTFKWAMGLMVTLTLALFTTAIYSAKISHATLMEIKVEQARTIANLETLNETMSTLKDLQEKEIDRIDYSLNHNHTMIHQLNQLLNKAEKQNDK